MTHDKNHPRPCKNHSVTFIQPFPLYTGRVYASSLLLCNKHIDKYPTHIIGAINLPATDHFMLDTYTSDDPQPTTLGISVGCADGTTMQATATDVLSIPELPGAARGCHKFQEISLPLISVPKLYQAGYNVHFSKDKVNVTTSHGKHLLTGMMDKTRNLYLLPIPSQSPLGPATVPTPPHTAANAYTIRPTTTLLQYLHATAGFPPLSTFKDGIARNAYITWLGLTVALVDALLQESPYTALGHLHKLKQGIHQTTHTSPK
uniref:Uncharacterized protein n=1 Tax=Pseudo-nitzschia australis TaxID=44445 RepID=A0A7S4ELS1_9STRA|mmetsp:Transcript_6286/g.13489  ORF Transcript_6286/g.13489 Transcript_6286/m.13489 type:complete len:261 (+) Transcript_6286:114-896(+)